MGERAGQLIEETAAHVRSVLHGEASGHDWFHIQRVWNNAKTINASEHADSTVIELAALLHDLGDYKVAGEELGSEPAREFLEKNKVEPDIVDHVCSIIDVMSFRKGKTPSTEEGKVVQDADRLDAIGAIGIARCFSFGGAFGRPMYDPENEKNSLSHFEEKLFKLKDLMNTKTARQIAEERHTFMEEYVKRFRDEWEGKR